jgi:hypothetical protein
MTLVDRFTFEGRGAHGTSDSDYGFAMTTCCERVGILDRELDDFYWSYETPSRSVSLLEDPPCPFCGASSWGLHHLQHMDQVPDHWRWACSSEPRPGSRRVLPLSEHVKELLAFCRRVASPLPDFDRTLFLITTDPRVRREDGWIIERSAFRTASEFSPEFDRLLVSGYSSMGLSAFGVFDGALIIGVDVPRETEGVAAGRTVVNYSGPPLGPDRVPTWNVRWTVVE